MIDYKVDEVTSKLVRSALGVFDKDGQKITVNARDNKPDKKSTNEYLNTVFIGREGEAIMPVDIRITFKNGEVVNEKWDGAYRWVKYEYTRQSKVKQVEVDPGHKLALDIDFANNSWTDEPDPSVLFKWTSTLLFWIQNGLQLSSVLG